MADADTMLPDVITESNYLLRMADGTIKQVNPFTGTEVWTVPGRGNRPLGVADKEGQPLDPAKADDHCSFCARRYLATPPEKARLVRTGDGYETLYNVNAERLHETVADFRRVANLFEIVSCDYWQKNFGYTLPDAVEARMNDYLSTEAGRNHVLEVLEGRMKLSGADPARIQGMPVEEKLQMATGFFGGGHELIIARRHFVDG